MYFEQLVIFETGDFLVPHFETIVHKAKCYKKLHTL